MNREIFLMIFGLALVTFIPRFLPFKLLENIKFSKRTSLVLKCIPFSAIGALILPDVVKAIPGNFLASFIGGVSAVVFSFVFNNYKNYLYVVIGSILMTYISIIIF